jgi:polysaccharide pyruvyl transferase CsaB
LIFEGCGGMREKRFRIGISGSYGGLNLGDEGILTGITTQLKNSLSDIEITVFSRNPKDTLKRKGVDRSVAVRNLSRDEAREEVRRLDLFILGGGGIIYDSEAETYLREVNLAHDLNIPVMVYAISVGPLTEPSIRKGVRSALSRAAIITVRDRQGRQLLEEVGVHQPIQVTADPALLLQRDKLKEDFLKNEGIQTKKKIVGFSVREPGPAAPDINVDHYHRLLANAADFIVERLNAEVVFVPMERQNMDFQHSHAVISQMQCAQKATVLKREYTPGQLIELISHFDFAVGMRLHFLIFSALANVPFVALPYSSKVQGFLEDLKIEMPTLERVSAGQLLARIDRAWDMRENVRTQIRMQLPLLQERARENHRILVNFISDHLSHETNEIDRKNHQPKKSVAS